MLRVLTLCLGNICRSPVAEALIESKFTALGFPAIVDSAGTGARHVGHLADPRSREVAQKHGLELKSLARQLSPADFYEQDIILAMDAQNLTDARRMAPPNATAKIRLMRDFDPETPGADVPDPYYGGPEGFETMYQMLDRSAEGFVQAAAQGQL